MIFTFITSVLSRGRWLPPAGDPVTAPRHAGACGAEVWIGPVSGDVRCELESGHGRWHRSEEAGWEWCDGQLWPLPRPA